MVLCRLVILLAKVEILQNSCSSVPFVFLKLSVCASSIVTLQLSSNLNLSWKHGTTQYSRFLPGSGVSRVLTAYLTVSVAGQVRVFVPFLGV